MTAKALHLSPLRSAAGDVKLPGSKSISNRALLLASLAGGVTRLDGLLDSDDTRVMIAALKQLGVRIDHIGDDQVQIVGGARFSVLRADLFLGNAGTAFRPLTAALAFMDGDYRLSGVPRMHERPIGDLVQSLQALGANIQYLANPGYPPLAIGRGSIQAARPVKVKGSVSSQFLTALLLAAPVHTAAAQQALIIEIEGELISKPYVLITLSLMARFGVQVQRSEWARFTIPAGSTYWSPGTMAIEGDASSASYFMALGAIGGGPVRVHGVGAESIQGDIAFVDTLEAMGVKVVRHPDSIEVVGVNVSRGKKLKAFDQDFNLIPDAAMTAAILALYADGPCTLRNIGSWRVKETDRIHAMDVELTKLGARVETGPDWIRVYPIGPSDWRPATITTYDDHRMAMCFSLTAFGPVPVTILDPGCVSKTFPDYFSVFNGLVQP